MSHPVPRFASPDYLFQREDATVNLYLVRHAQAKPEEIDPERPLSQAGVETAKRVARFLKQSDAISVAEIRHSTKLRARQTAEILATDGGLGAPLVEVNGLEPMADVDAVALALQSVSHDLMLVGHLPYLNRLASALVADLPNLDAFSFGECSILHLRREEGSPREVWKVVWMLSSDLLHNPV